MVRWLFMAGMSCVVAVLAVVGGLALLPKGPAAAVSGAPVGGVVMVLAGLVFGAMAKRSRGR
jgi:hypothetical protein